MESSRLNIRRFRAQYLIPGDHPAPHRVKTRLDDAIALPVLRQAISSVLSSFFPAIDESVWMIRRLDFNLDVNAAWERDQLTRAIVAQLAREVGLSLGDAEHSGNVLRFANRAAYLARFLSDVAAGTAGGRWYYESFSGLRLLSTSAALRSAICDRPGIGRDALLLLSNHELDVVLRALTKQDVVRVLDRISESETNATEFECCQMAWSAAADSLGGDLKSADQWQLVLRLFLNATRDRADATGPALKAAALALVTLARVLSESPAEERQPIVSALTKADLGALHLAAGANAEQLTPFLTCPPEWIASVVTTLLARDSKRSSVSEAGTARRDTSFGGIFLLLPLLDELPLLAATEGWQHSDETAAITLVRFLVIVKCCGQLHATRAFYDPLLRDLMLVPPAITPSVIGDWSGCVNESQLRVFLETFRDWQHGLAVEGKQQILRNKRTDDFSFLALPETITIWPELDKALSVAAQHVLRAFAWCLPGFAESSLSYLSANFLNFSSSLEEEAARRVVYVGRPPLHLVLGFTGKSRQTYRVSWLDQRPFVLFPEN